MKKVGIGIIGLGFMGTTHLRIYQNLPNAQIVAIADVDLAKRQGDVSAVCGNIGGGDNNTKLDFSNVKVYADGQQLIDDPKVDIVDICCPTIYHKDYIVSALAHGKHVMAEKPFARNLDDAREIVAAYQKATTYLNFGMCVRAWPEYRYAYENFQAGKYGKMLSATFRRLSPSVAGNGWNDWFMIGKNSGGALLDMHLHDTDEVCYFFGRPEAVSSFGRNMVSDDAIDQVITLYHFADGALVEAEGCWAAPNTTPFEMSFQIICEKATIRLMSEGFKVYWNDGRVETPEVEATTGWHKELAYFVDCVANQVTPDKYQTFDSVLDGFKVVMAEQDSINRGGQKVEINY